MHEPKVQILAINTFRYYERQVTANDKTCKCRTENKYNLDKNSSLVGVYEEKSIKYFSNNR